MRAVVVRLTLAPEKPPEIVDKAGVRGKVE
jgi:hypothetical protein